METYQKIALCSGCYQENLLPFPLSCNHQMCLSCAVKNMKFKNVDCPSCGEISVASKDTLDNIESNSNELKLMYNYFIESQVDSKNNCISCSEVTELYCLKCGCYVCTTCSEAHSENVFTKHHPPLIDTSKQSLPKICEEHNSKMRLICCQCRKLVCNTCVAQAHCGHNIQSIITASNTKREELRTNLNTAFDTTSVNEQETAISENIKILNKFYQYCENYVQECADKFNQEKTKISIRKTTAAITEENINNLPDDIILLGKIEWRQPSKTSIYVQKNYQLKWNLDE